MSPGFSGLMAKAKQFAASPEGRRAAEKAMDYAKSPKGKQQIAAAREKLARGRGGGGARPPGA